MHGAHAKVKGEEAAIFVGRFSGDSGAFWVWAARLYIVCLPAPEVWRAWVWASREESGARRSGFLRDAVFGEGEVLSSEILDGVALFANTPESSI
jgi:hypothetical protein